MLEIRKGTAARNYENTFFREFAENLGNLFKKYSIDGLLIANSECEEENRLQIDALLVTRNVVCIIDFKNFGGKITLPKNARSEFEYGRWTNGKGEIIKGGNSINPFIQLKNQKERFIKVTESHISNRLKKPYCFNPYHTIRTVCFQKSIELKGTIPPKEELNFFIIDRSNYLEKIRDIIDITDKEVSIPKKSFDLFKEVFRADLYDISENYEKTTDFTSYESELDFDNLYQDQKSSLVEIENFIKSDDEKYFVLQGTSLSGKTHLIPFIQDIAFKNKIPEVKLFASSGRVSNNLLKNSNLDFKSIYSYIYGGNTQNEKREDALEDNDEMNKELKLEIVPLKKSDDTEECIYIIDESQLVSDNYHQSIDLRFGSGRLLEDFIKFTDCKNTKRKIIFIGDSYQLSIGKKEESTLNPDYLKEKYKGNVRAFQLIDKEDKSPLVLEALKAVKSIRQQSFNNLSFEFSERLNKVSKDISRSAIENSLNSDINSQILCYSNYDAQKVNFWIKSSILKNGFDLTKDDLIVFGNNIRVEDANDPFAEPKKIFNGQFGTIIDVSESLVKKTNLLTPLTFREVVIKLKESNHVLRFLSLENYRLSDKGELSKEEIVSFKILLNQLAEKELENFKKGNLYADEELKELFVQLDEGKRVKMKVLTKIQRLLGNMPASEYYRIKNSAQLRFGWALTVHKAMSNKWDEIFFNVETGRGKTNENYFKWIYTGLIRASQKVNLINYESITPFIKLNIRSTSDVNSGGKHFFYIADTTADLSRFDPVISDKFKFPESETTSSLLQLFQFINIKIEKERFRISSIIHSNYQELYEFKGNDGESATVLIYYNKKGQFKMPALMNSQPSEFGNEVLNLLKSKNEIVDFGFIKDSWRITAYEHLRNKIKPANLSIAYIIQTPYKDSIQLIRDDENLIVDIFYDGDGFFSVVSASAYSELGLWTDFQKILNNLKNE
ncbi:NERD domain-containing protein [Lutimonas vermicola]|uniref:NERD domain-containing protein n=1 Tax=Lutimonas vermicola TaxID=414288 RepID=A0ABU9L4M0_9FLAO